MVTAAGVAESHFSTNECSIKVQNET